MKRLIIAFTLALLFISAENSEAGRCIHYYRYGYRPLVCHRAHPRVWVPAYWRWDWRYHRYYRVPGYWY